MNIAVCINESDLILIDPRPCGLCGLTVDRHEMVERGEGPEHFCPDLAPDDMTLPELERRAELRRQEGAAAIMERWERTDPRDRWKHTGEPPPPTEVRNAALEAPAAPCRTPRATIEAFRHHVADGDVDRLKAWLIDRPKDAPFLLALLESPAS